MTSFDLTGRRALVTGAGRGIGRAVSIALAEAGAEVKLVARTAAEIEAVAARIHEAGGKADAIICDVTDVGAFAEIVESNPPCDVFVNNAGTNHPKPLKEVTEQDFDAVMGLNVRAAIFATQAVTNRMIATGTTGSVINMSSQMGHVGAANRTLYCASKWALEGFTKALAVEMGPHDIRVNTICPTFVETPMTQPMLADPEFRKEVEGKIKLPRLGQPKDVAAAVIYLASDASAMMTGSALMLDGGWTAD